MKTTNLPLNTLWRGLAGTITSSDFWSALGVVAAIIGVPLLLGFVIYLNVHAAHVQTRQLFDSYHYKTHELASCDSAMDEINQNSDSSPNWVDCRIMHQASGNYLGYTATYVTSANHIPVTGLFSVRSIQRK